MRVIGCFPKVRRFLAAGVVTAAVAGGAAVAAWSWPRRLVADAYEIPAHTLRLRSVKVGDGWASGEFLAEYADDKGNRYVLHRLVEKLFRQYAGIWPVIIRLSSADPSSTQGKPGWVFVNARIGKAMFSAHSMY